MGFKIRTYQSEDQNEVLHLFRLNSPKYFDPNEEIDFQNYLLQEIDQYFVVTHNQNVIACGGINFGFENGTAARIAWDMVHPDYHGKGVGTLLTQHRIQKIEAIKPVSKIIVRTSQVVYPFYQKLGFSMVHQKANYWAPGLDLYELHKTIK